MKKIILVIALIFTSSICRSNAVDPPESVNAIIGDESFLKTFGHLPDDNTDEILRLRTHLRYVEGLIRDASSAMPAAQREKRLRLMDMLHTYWQAGIFPQNTEIPHRTPRFIDHEGRICALGYLIEQTAGRAAAEAINQKHEYEYVMQMEDDVVDAWITVSGLTRIECAMIQPEYQQWRNRKVYPPGGKGSPPIKSAPAPAPVLPPPALSPPAPILVNAAPGQNVLNAVMAKHFTYPPLCESLGMTGNVYFTCIIDFDSTVKGISIYRVELDTAGVAPGQEMRMYLSKEMEDEALKILQQLPRLGPAYYQATSGRINTPVASKMNGMLRIAWTHGLTLTPATFPPKKVSP